MMPRIGKKSSEGGITNVSSEKTWRKTRGIQRMVMVERPTSVVIAFEWRRKVVFDTGGGGGEER